MMNLFATVQSNMEAMCLQMEVLQNNDTTWMVDVLVDDITMGDHVVEEEDIPQ